MASVVDNTRRWKAPLRWTALTAMLASLIVHDIHPALHAAMGSVFVVATGAHVLANARWIRTVTRRASHGLPRRVALDAVLAAALAVVTAAIAVTGMGALVGADTPDRIAHVHGHLAIALGIVLIAHLVRHRRQLVPRSTPARRPPHPASSAH